MGIDKFNAQCAKVFRLGVCLVWTCLCLVGGAAAQPASVRDVAPVQADKLGTAGRAVIGLQVAHMEDPTLKLGIDAVRALDGANSRFVASQTELPNFGYSGSAHWLRFTIAPTNVQKEFLLSVGLPSLDSVQLYSPDETGSPMQSAGDQSPWATRTVRHRHHVFNLRSVPGGPGTFYLRVQSQSVVTVPLTLWTPAAFAEHERQAQLAYGLFYGLIAAMFLYNLALLVALRDTTYLYYTSYVATLGLGLFTFDGFAFEYFWPNNVVWANHALAFMLATSMMFATLFARNFMATAIHEPVIDRVNKFVVAACAVMAFCAATGLFMTYAQIMQGMSAMAVGGAVVSLVVAVRGLARGYRPARFFILAWGMLLMCIVLAALRNFALIPSNFLTMNGLHIGFGFDVLLLSFALGDRINMLRRQTLQAQAALLESAQRHERELEVRVQDRTEALADLNRQLRDEANEREALLRRLGESETRMRHLAQHDALTGLPNRLSLHERFALGAEYAKRNRRKLAVMLIDLDRFKELNDTRGHAAGDEALVAMGARLRTTVRGSDTVARLGGDEFVVLAADLDDRESVRPVVDKISDVMGIPVSAGGGAWQMSASVGVALYPDDGTTLDDLLKLADRGMYADKVARRRRKLNSTGEG